MGKYVLFSANLAFDIFQFIFNSVIITKCTSKYFLRWESYTLLKAWIIFCDFVNEQISHKFVWIIQAFKTLLQNIYIGHDEVGLCWAVLAGVGMADSYVTVVPNNLLWVKMKCSHDDDLMHIYHTLTEIQYIN